MQSWGKQHEQTEDVKAAQMWAYNFLKRYKQEEALELTSPVQMDSEPAISPVFRVAETSEERKPIARPVQIEYTH